MSRELRLIFPVTLLAICVLSSGCDTVYSDMYSPRRNYFVPPKEKKPEVPIPLEETVTTPADAPGVLPPPAPSAAPLIPPAPTTPPDPTQPVIPGL